MTSCSSAPKSCNTRWVGLRQPPHTALSIYSRRHGSPWSLLPCFAHDKQLTIAEKGPRTFCFRTVQSHLQPTAAHRPRRLALPLLPAAAPLLLRGTAVVKSARALSCARRCCLPPPPPPPDTRCCCLPPPPAPTPVEAAFSWCTCAPYPDMSATGYWYCIMYWAGSKYCWP